MSEFTLDGDPLGPVDLDYAASRLRHDGYPICKRQLREACRRGRMQCCRRSERGKWYVDGQEAKSFAERSTLYNRSTTRPHEMSRSLREIIERYGNLRATG